MYSICYFCHN